MGMLKKGTDVMSRFGIKERNLGGQTAMDFAKRMGLRNNY